MALAPPQAIAFLSRGDSGQIPSRLGVTLKFFASVVMFLKNAINVYIYVIVDVGVEHPEIFFFYFPLYVLVNHVC